MCSIQINIPGTAALYHTITRCCIGKSSSVDPQAQKFLLFLNICNYSFKEPIALDYRTVVLPHIDAIEDSNFHYRGQYGPGRGVIDWEFGHFRLPLPAKDLKKLPEPYE